MKIQKCQIEIFFLKSNWIVISHYSKISKNFGSNFKVDLLIFHVLIHRYIDLYIYIYWFWSKFFLNSFLNSITIITIFNKIFSILIFLIYFSASCIIEYLLYTKYFNILTNQMKLPIIAQIVVKDTDKTYYHNYDYSKDLFYL